MARGAHCLGGCWRKKIEGDEEALPLAVNASSSPVPLDPLPASPAPTNSATAGESCATGKGKIPPRLPLVAEPGLEVFISADELKTLARGGKIRVHRHGSGKYRGQYLCLRPSGRRTDKRPMLASGRPYKLRDYLSSLGIRLCLSHRAIDPCPGCSKSKRKGRVKQPG